MDAARRPQAFARAALRMSFDPSGSTSQALRPYDAAAPDRTMSTASPRTPTLLVVDDEPELRGLLGEYFGRHGFDVQLAEDAAAARQLLALGVPDVAILDVNMPGENGLSLARWLRQSQPALGLLMLTTAGESVDRIIGLELGADDYVPKPFDLRELLARVRAIQRRVQLVTDAAARLGGAAALAGGTGATRRVAFGHCLLDIDQRKLFGEQGNEIDITAAEFDLLALLAANPNRPLNRDQIMEQAHNRGWDVFDRSIDLRVMRLRRKIERNPDKPEIIKTVRNVGYDFVSTNQGLSTPRR